MAVLTLQESEAVEFDVIPEGTIVTLDVVSVEDRETPWDVDENDPSKGKKHQISFLFEVSSGEHQGRKLFGNTPTTFTTHPDCKLRAWVQEILGEDALPVNFQLDTDALVGLPVKGVVAHRMKKNADGSQTPKEYVSDVIRVGGYADAGDLFND